VEKYKNNEEEELKTVFRWIAFFTIIPVTEIIIYVQLGQYIGVLPTLVLILGTGAAGVILTRQQGFYILAKVKEELRMGSVPGNQLLEGLLVLIGAVLLITPGLLTDITGFIVLFPFTRVYIREILKRKLRKWVNEGKIDIYFHTR
jgi:UPF0716 protein FxsA